MNGVQSLHRGALPAVFIGLAAVSPAAAQPRAQLVSDMAFSLGQSHALRQACLGPNDQYWRDRMTKMIQLETAGPAERGPLAERFNDGFRVAREQYPRCTLQSRGAERSAADRGKALAGLLAREPATR